MKELLEYIAMSLVDDKEAVSVKESETESTITLTLSVGEGDMGKVIGKQGRIAKAIRTLMRSASIKTGKKVIVEIV